MSKCWADFKDSVKAEYWQAGAPTNAQKYRAIADLAHSLFVRQTQSDLPLAKSFSDSYEVQKLKLAGSCITGTLTVVTAAVQALLPVDTDTAGSEALLANAIEQARDDFNGTAAQFDFQLLNAVMDLQRHVPFYQARSQDCYRTDTEGLVNKGFVSKITLDGQSRIEGVWASRFHTALAEGQMYVADDEVESNGRFYKVVIGGQLNIGQLGTGLQSTDRCTDEVLGNVTFKYHGALRSIPVRKWPWADREALFSGSLRMGPLYTTSPQFDTLWLYPALINQRQFVMIESVGVKTTYCDEDEVTFDKLAAQAAAQYIRAMLAKDVAQDGRASSAALALYQALVRNAVIDNQARDTGTTTQVSELLAMNLGRISWWRWSLMNCSSVSSQTSSPSNSEYEQDNASGDVTVTPQSSNHVAKINYSGAAGSRNVILSTNRQVPSGGTIVCQRGDRIIVNATFDATVGIALTFHNATLIGPVIPSAAFTSDGVNLNIVIEFVYDGTQWQYLRAQIPA